MHKFGLRFTVWAAIVPTVLLVGCSESYNPASAPNMKLSLELRRAMGGDSSAGGASDSGAAQVREPVGWATLKGRFVLDGTAPEPTRLTISGSDASICAPGGKPVFSDALVVGSDGGIKGVLVYCTADLPPDEPFTHSSARPGQGGEVEFDQKACVFLSHVFGMQTGQTMRILNSDPIGHNTKIDETPINQIVGAGSSITYTPNEQWKKPKKVSCSIHPWMEAYMIVRENGYFAVTDENGNFEIPNLPAGIDLEFRFWHETVSLDGVDVGGKPVKKGRVEVTLPPEGMTINGVLNGSALE